PTPATRASAARTARAPCRQGKIRVPGAGRASPRRSADCTGPRAMEFKQLEMFVRVAEERSVQRAAARVFRTQAAVSMAITKLEDEARRPLFLRSRREPFRL